MDTALAQHLSRLSKMLLAGLGVAFAWVLLSFALGLSTGQAHADDDGLLGGLASTVGETTSAVTDVVDDTAAAVVAPVVQAVAEPVAAAVQPAAPAVRQVAQAAPVAPAVHVLQAAVAPVVRAADGAVESGVVAPIVDSAVSVVGAVPVVGGISAALGVDAAASTLGSSVDGVLQSATRTVDDAVISPVSGVLAPVVDSAPGVVSSPALPAITPPDVVDGVGLSTGAPPAVDAAPGPIETSARAAYLTGASMWSAMLALPSAVMSGDGSGVDSLGTGILFTLLRSASQADSVFVGPGGAGPGAWVLLALGFVVAHRAWVRRTGLENDAAPPAPVLSTDVSPD